LIFILANPDQPDIIVLVMLSCKKKDI